MASVERQRRQEGRAIPAALSVRGMPGLSREMVQRLAEVRPATLGQASRIPGVTPAAVAVVAARPRSARSGLTPNARRGYASILCEWLARRLPDAALDARRASKAGVFLDERSDRRARRLLRAALERWNRKINLTSLEDPDEAIDRLLLEPVVAARHLPARCPSWIMDVGSGGGSPAIPLTLALGPHVALTMVEVKARKSAFLREAVRAARACRTRGRNSRFEELLTQAGASRALRRGVDSRRAGRAANLMTLQAFLKPGGSLLLFRGSVRAGRSRQA